MTSEQLKMFDEAIKQAQEGIRAADSDDTPSLGLDGALNAIEALLYIAKLLRPKLP